MAKILIIGDEKSFAPSIKKGLKKEGFTVNILKENINCLKLTFTKEYDAVILENILPYLNGLEIYQKIRGRYLDSFAVVILKELAASDKTINDLNNEAIGACENKPFIFKEPMSEINVELKQKNEEPVLKFYKFEDLELNLETRIAIRAGKLIHLTLKEFRLLKYFMANPNIVLSRTNILKNVWGADFTRGTNIVEVYIKYLRDKIDKRFSKKLIHTLIGMGYILKE